MALVEVGNKMQNGQIEVTQPDELMQANLQLSYMTYMTYMTYMS